MPTRPHFSDPLLQTRSYYIGRRLKQNWCFSPRHVKYFLCFVYVAQNPSCDFVTESNCFWLMRLFSKALLCSALFWFLSDSYENKHARQWTSLRNISPRTQINREISRGKRAVIQQTVLSAISILFDANCMCAEFFIALWANLFA